MMLKTKKLKMVFTIAIIIAIVTAIITVSWIYYRNLPQSVPRNVKIMVDDEMSHFVTLLELNENTLDITVFANISIGNFQEGYAFGDYTIEDFELLDETLLDDFAESLTYPWLNSDILSNARSVNIVADRWSVELSPQQLNEIWVHIDTVVRRYEISLCMGTNRISARAVIDGEFYSGCFIYRDGVINYPHLPREERRFINECTDINLLKLTHHLADIAPIRMGWKYNPFFPPGQIENMLR
jgi:hypothetical protein